MDFMEDTPSWLLVQPFLISFFVQLFFSLDNTLVLSLAFFRLLDDQKKDLKQLKQIILVSWVLKLVLFSFLIRAFDFSIVKTLTGVYLCLISVVFFRIVKGSELKLNFLKSKFPLIFILMVGLDLILSMDAFAGALSFSSSAPLILVVHSFVVLTILLSLKHLLNWIHKIPFFEETTSFLLFLFGLKFLYLGFFASFLSESWLTFFNQLFHETTLILLTLLFGFVLWLIEFFRKFSK
jgi:hypothetical protein